MVKKFMCILIALFSVLYLKAQENLNLWVDVSGSIAGQSANRSYDSFSKIKNELRDFVPYYISKGGSINIITFTDSVIFHKIISQDNIHETDFLISKIFPHKGNSNLINILKDLNKDEVNVLISDGLNNISMPDISYDDILNSTFADSKNIFMLRIYEGDDNQTIKAFKNHNRLIDSLKDLNIQTNDTNNNQRPDTTEIITNFNKENEIVVNKADDSTSYNWLWIFWIIIAVGFIMLIVYCIIKLSPLIINTSAAGMQSSIYWLYNLPKPIHYIFRHFTSPKMKKFLNDEMVSYKNYNKGKFIPSTEQQKEAADAYKKLTGKWPRYKNGEIDFEPVAKFKVKLNKGLDNIIPKGKDVRKNVHKAQEYAADQMIKSKKGKELIANYNNISPDEVNNYDQFRKWKDDELRRDSQDFNPLTPHETSDGREILFVPKRLHDVAWGGISHTGGVSMLSKIRDTFGA